MAQLMTMLVKFRDPNANVKPADFIPGANSEPREQSAAERKAFYRALASRKKKQ